MSNKLDKIEMLKKMNDTITAENNSSNIKGFGEIKYLAHQFSGTELHYITKGQMGKYIQYKFSELTSDRKIVFDCCINKQVLEVDAIKCEIDPFERKVLFFIIDKIILDSLFIDCLSINGVAAVDFNNNHKVLMNVLKTDFGFSVKYCNPHIHLTRTIRKLKYIKPVKSKKSISK